MPPLIQRVGPVETAWRRALALSFVNALAAQRSTGLTAIRRCIDEEEDVARLLANESGRYGTCTVVAMTKSFGSLTFTAAVKALQERYGSRRQYERLEQRGEQRSGFGPQETEFITERDSCYIATTGSTGWPYIQHRGGPPGFLKVLDAETIAFADFRGNKQYVSVGNIATDDRVALILVDYPNQARLKVLGKARILEREQADEVMGRVRSPAYPGVIESVFVIHVEAFDWNCPQHITPRYTEEQIRAVLQPTIARMEQLERENRELRRLASRRD